MRAPLVKKPEAPRGAGTAFRSAPGFHPVGARQEADKGPWGGPPPWAIFAPRNWRETGPVVQRRAVATGSGLGGLAVSVPSDPAEREAEAIAARVLAPAAPVTEPVRPTAGGGARVDRKCASCEEEENGAGKAEGDKIHRRGEGVPEPPAIEAAAGAIGAGGEPLPAGERRSFEDRMGFDLSRVRVHADRPAAEAARSLDAEAFTVGRDVAFADGRYRPGTRDGRGLLAHELAHVVQQGGVPPLAGGGPRPIAAGHTPVRIARQPAVGKPSAAPQAQPPAPQQQPAETNADKPVDKYKGTHVSRVIVSVARSRVGFQTPLGMLLGDIDTDLKPGEYKLKPVLAKQQWVVTGPNVKSGLRFDLTLDNANPWTLVYPDELRMTVATGSAEEPKTFGDAVDPATGKMKDPLAIFEGVPTLEPVSGIDDVEDVHYNLDYRSEKGGLSKFLQANYRDNSHRDINIDSISESTPKLFAAKQEVLRIMDDYNAMFILGTFNTIFFIITMRPLAMDPATRAGGGGAVTRYVAFRRTLTKSGAGMVGGGGKTPDLQPPEPSKAPGETVNPPETGAAAKPLETVPPATDPKAPAPAPNAPAPAPAVVENLELDVNVVSRAINKSHPQHEAALKFLEGKKNAGAQMTINRHTYQKLLESFSKDQIKGLRDQIGFRLLREVDLDEIAATAARVEKAFAGTGREISAEDARVAATAIERGDRLATADLQFYKRARDLGVDVDFIGTGNAADKAAAYKPVPTKLPPP